MINNLGVINAFIVVVINIAENQNMIYSALCLTYCDSHTTIINTNEIIKVYFLS